ncbi:Hypothetical protein PP7435_CHR4-1019 [Komagataella phaffii CBS 7435]|uniref:Uncharacterized protein n=1 Tax=Komagataella phaffii (strain ATCC 76273 / CBS 7435 / CECT 11047 / NRRL Y-11430 / Wegner 21-1) TaxID=981350 RepID=F2R0J0_KOMPC|nr:Hypothetical protein PP7435_CHR4-1019 [Komagataella phaffii CBS 7435]
MNFRYLLILPIYASIVLGQVGDFQLLLNAKEPIRNSPSLLSSNYGNLTLPAMANGALESHFDYGNAYVGDDQITVVYHLPDEHGQINAYRQDTDEYIGYLGLVTDDYGEYTYLSVIMPGVQYDQTTSVNWYIENEELKSTSINVQPLLGCYYKNPPQYSWYWASIDEPGNIASSNFVCEPCKVYVDFVPTPSADITSMWTGSETSWTTDADGTVIELVPTPSADATSVWTGDHTTWTTDDDGNVIEQIPTPSADITSMWTGSETSWTTDADGTVIELVPTPSADITSMWTGSETSWTTDADGTVIELVPTPSADATSVWTDSYSLR